MQKRSYHTDIILNYKLGLLPQSSVQSIPRSTRHYWRHNSYSNLVGREFLFLEQGSNESVTQLILQHKKLLRLTKVLYHAHCCYQKIVASKLKQSQLAHFKNEIISVINRCAPVTGVRRASKFMGITAATYYYWKSLKTCHHSLFNHCYKLHPLQLTQKEIARISMYLADDKLSHWPITSIYYKLIRDKKAAVSLSTFYKYARQLGHKRKIIRPEKPKQGLRADYPYQYLHMDVTVFRTADRSKCYLYVVADNYSRKILSLTASDTCNSTLCFENFKNGLQGIDQRKITLICDDGSENKGRVDDFFDAQQLMNKLIAQKHVRFSNSLVEAINRCIKQGYLYRKSLTDLKALQIYLPEIIEDYNNRPHISLKGCTPNEVASGTNPKNLNMMRTLSEARKERLLINSKTRCDIC